MRVFCTVIFIVISCQVSFAGEADTSLSISGAWARPTILMNRPGAAYFTIVNEGPAGDRLVSVMSPMVNRVEMHVHRQEDGVMRMMQVPYIPIAAHSRTEVKPGGYHLMLFGLAKKLNVGDELPLRLTFKQAGEIAVTAIVMKKAP